MLPPRRQRPQTNDKAQTFHITSSYNYASRCGGALRTDIDYTYIKYYIHIRQRGNSSRQRRPAPPAARGLGGDDGPGRRGGLGASRVLADSAGRRARAGGEGAGGASRAGSSVEGGGALASNPVRRAAGEGVLQEEPCVSGGGGRWPSEPSEATGARILTMSGESGAGCEARAPPAAEGPPCNKPPSADRRGRGARPRGLARGRLPVAPPGTDLVRVVRGAVRVGRRAHLVAVVGQDVAEARPALLGHRDGRAEVALHLRSAHTYTPKQRLA